MEPNEKNEKLSPQRTLTSTAKKDFPKIHIKGTLISFALEIQHQISKQLSLHNFYGDISENMFLLSEKLRRKHLQLHWV